MKRRGAFGALACAARTLTLGAARQRALLSLVEKLASDNAKLTSRLFTASSDQKIYRAALDCLGAALVMIDRAGFVRVVTRHAAGLLGAREEELVGGPFEDVFGVPLPGSDASRITLAPACGKVFSGGCELRPIGCDGGDWGLALLLCGKEEAERGEGREQLAELGKVAAEVAHEIRNPLHGIAGIADLLYNDPRADERRKRLARHISDAAGTLNQIVTGILEFARPSAEETRLVRLEELAGDVLALAVGELEGVEVRLEGLGDAGEVRCRAREIKQVLLNLVRNAAEAMEGSGVLRLSATRSDGDVSLSVSDTGRGIPQENLERIFKPFYTTKPSGTGLGLAIAQKLIRAHGGRISVESRLGCGTTFTVVLPVAGLSDESAESTVALGGER